MDDLVDHYGPGGSVPKRPRIASRELTDIAQPAAVVTGLPTEHHRPRISSSPFRLPTPSFASHGWPNGTSPGLPLPNGFQQYMQGGSFGAMHGARPRAMSRVPIGQLSEHDKFRAALEAEAAQNMTNGGGGSSSSAALPTNGAAQDVDSVIDLTKDDDVVFVGEKKLRRVIPDEVCYGTLTGCRISAHTVPAPYHGSDRLPDKWPSIPLKLGRGQPNSFTICATDPSGRQFGCVDINTARALAPLMDLGICRIQARTYSREKLPGQIPGTQVSTQLSFYVNVYGPEHEGRRVATLISQKNVFFQRPYPENVDPLPYKNPHNPSETKYAQPNQVNYVTRSAEEIRKDVNNVFDGMNQAETLPEMEPDPRITTPLITHQKQGLAFLISKEKARTFEKGEKENTSLWRRRRKGTGEISYYHIITGEESTTRPPDVLGGILADMMGLGKTLQILSLIVTTLPASEEYAKKKPPPPPPRPAKGPEPEQPVMCAKTTLLICPLSTIGNWEEQVATHVQEDALNYYIYHGNKREQDIEKLVEYDMIITTYSVVANEFGKHAKDKKHSAPLQEISFFRIVLDEAHMIREQSTLQSKAVVSLHAQRRWAVTGTPVQNKLNDLAALIKFLRMKPFDEKAQFNQHIALPVKNADVDCIVTLRLLVDSITLRRLKDRIDLPPREDRITYLKFSRSEQEIYDATAKQSSTRMDLVARSGHVGGKGYVHILQMILRLRLICAHGRELLGEDDMAALAGMTSSDAINVDEIDDNSPNLSPKQAYQLFSLMKETNQDMCTLCQHKAVYKDPAVLAEESEKDKDVKDVKPGKSSASTAKCTTIGYLTTCAHILCKECVPRFTASITTDGAAFEYGTRGTCPICSLYNKLDLFELKWDEMAEHESGEASGGPGRKKNFHYRGPSTKVSALLQDLLANRTQSTAEDPIKSVVFSCWTTHMDLIELAFNANGIRFVRLDGKLSRSARNAAIAQFREDSSIEVILVSLMAGGLGLNLTAACRVYVMEPQFNPAAEAQAIDRIHRLGQKRPVVTTRFIMAKSFEEKIMDLQRKKTDLANLTLSQGRKMNKNEVKKQRLLELKSLFSK